MLTQKGYKSSDEIKIFKNLDNLLNYCEGLDSEVFVIGGSEIYKLLEPYCTRLVITHVLKEFDGDSFFPINLEDWNNVSSEKFTDESSELRCEIKIYNKA